MSAHSTASGYSSIASVSIAGVLLVVFASACGVGDSAPAGPPKPTRSMAIDGCSAMALGVGADFNGLVPFSSDNAWNLDVSSLPVDPDSDAIIKYISASAPVHPDFDDDKGGVPYIVVDSTTTPLVSVALKETGESDVFPMPIPANTPIEAGSDHHILVVDRKTCWLYEFWEASYEGRRWTANNGAAWDLKEMNQRPYTWTSADAAGLPILPGLIRYDEVASGAIHHALRFTAPRTVAAIIPPATHWAQTNRGSPIPMGMRLRLKANFDISGFSQSNQVILTAMKKYGLILADNGTEMYITGAPDKRWSVSDLNKLKRIRALDFEVLKMPPKITEANLPTGHPPMILKFTASPNPVKPGTPVTLEWQATNTSYYYINPLVGAVRGNTATFTPGGDVTYELTATGPYGRSTAKLLIRVK
jgi:hypothetical protein